MKRGRPSLGRTLEEKKEFKRNWMRHKRMEENYHRCELRKELHRQKVVRARAPKCFGCGKPPKKVTLQQIVRLVPTEQGLALRTVLYCGQC